MDPTDVWKFYLPSNCDCHQQFFRFSHYMCLIFSQGILTGESGLFPFWPLCQRYGAPAILTVTYGGELLYFRIWHDHSSRSAHIIITVWFTSRKPICVHDLSPRGKGNSRLTKLLSGLATKKSGGTITHLHTWWQDGCHNRFPL